MSVREGGARRPTQVRLEVDWSRCRGHGHCAVLLPELVRLDTFGYPIVSGVDEDATVPVGSEEVAERAVSWCPNLALRLRT